MFLYSYHSYYSYILVVCSLVVRSLFGRCSISVQKVVHLPGMNTSYILILNGLQLFFVVQFVVRFFSK